MFLGRPERQFRMSLCFASDVFFQRRISELPRPIAVKLRHMMGSWLNFIMQVQKFVGAPPKKNLGPKHAKIWSILYHLIQTLIGNISGMRQHYPKSEERFLLRLTKKS